MARSFMEPILLHHYNGYFNKNLCFEDKSSCIVCILLFVKTLESLSNVMELQRGMDELPITIFVLENGWKEAVTNSLKML